MTMLYGQTMVTTPFVARAAVSVRWGPSSAMGVTVAVSKLGEAGSPFGRSESISRRGAPRWRRAKLDCWLVKGGAARVVGSWQSRCVFSSATA